MSHIHYLISRKCEDPDFWRTVRDPSTGQDVVLSKEDLQLIQRIREGQVPNPDHDEYQVRNIPPKTNISFNGIEHTNTNKIFAYIM